MGERRSRVVSQAQCEPCKEREGILLRKRREGEDKDFRVERRSIEELALDGLTHLS